MKNILVMVAFVLCMVMPAIGQRVVADCTLTFSISVDDGPMDAEIAKSLRASTMTVYIRGNDSRSDLVSPTFSQSMIYDKTNGAAIVLREFGNNKFMTKLDAKGWVALNKKYEGMNLQIANESKNILGYECKKAVMQLKDGSSFSLYYATAIIPSVREFEYQFKDVPGLVLEFENVDEQQKKIRFTASKINFTPVQASRFDIPTKGYRLLN